MTSSTVLLVVAHPALERSRANAALLLAARDIEGLAVHDLYELYPDFIIDIDHEQAVLEAHEVIALLFPFYWYSTPALLKEWLDLVWQHGFAYGRGGTQLMGKRLFIACSTGGRAEAYHALGDNRFTMDEYLRPLEQTAHLCGMTWETPFVVHGAGQKAHDELLGDADRFARRLHGLIDQAKAGINS